jgi:hypothetical protein
MSMSEPFLPAHEPPSEPDPRERDIDTDADVFVEPDEETDLAEEVPVRENAPRPPFRTPTPGDGLTPDQLADDLMPDGGDQDS